MGDTKEKTFFKIGLEIHLQLDTSAKIFSKTPSIYDLTPNRNINNLDVGEPGTLPSIDPKAVILAMRLVSFFRCNYNAKVISFLRKNYFYNDLPKGYQITQLYNSVGLNGHFEISVYNQKKEWVKNKVICIERVQIEEDTAKKQYAEGELQLNFNRCGIPLVEIVTAPSFDNSDEIICFLKVVRFFLQKFQISKARFDKGEIRCDVNISINSSSYNGARTEIKNLNSFLNIRKAVTQEKQLLITAFEEGTIIISKTKKFNETTQLLEFMRKKELESNYLFFCEPNLPFINFVTPGYEKKMIWQIRNTTEFYKQLIKGNIFYDYHSVIFRNGDWQIFDLLTRADFNKKAMIDFFFRWVVQKNKILCCDERKVCALYSWYQELDCTNISYSLLFEVIHKYWLQDITITEMNAFLTRSTDNYLTESQIKEKVIVIIRRIENSLARKTEQQAAAIIFGLVMKENARLINHPKETKKLIITMWIDKKDNNNNQNE